MRLGDEGIAVIGVGDPDQGSRPLPDRPAAQLGHTELGHDLVDGVLGVVTTAPATRRGTIRDAPALVAEWRTTKPWPPTELIAARAKSCWPPDDE